MLALEFLVELLTKLATWKKHGKKGLISIDAPLKIARTYQSRVGRWRVAVWFASVDGEPELVATSEEITVAGDGRAIEVVVHAGPVTLPRVGRYEFDLLANGKRVRTQGVRFTEGR